MSGSTCIRYTMVLLNALLALIGGVLVCLGSYHIIKTVSTNWEIYFVLIVVALGLTVIFTAVCGCVGGINENYCLLVTHTTFMFLLMSLSAVGAVVIFVVKNKLAKFLLPHMKDMSYCYADVDICELIFESRISFSGYVLIIITIVKVMMVLFGAFVIYLTQKEKRRLV